MDAARKHNYGPAQEGPRPKAMVAMSGGVDSSVAALLAIEGGLDATGVTCKMFGSNVLGSDGDGFDAFMDEVDDAKQVCRRLGIEHYVFNYKDPFEQCVIGRFVDDYLHGRTPNPCVDCNVHVKFGALHKRREQLGFDVLVTGHYAQVEHDDAAGRWRLLRARHAEKDQSYMLCRLSQEQLAHSAFPLGALSKEEVRDLAQAAGFSNARKGESQDICFIPDGDYAGFIEQWAEGKLGAAGMPGPIEDSSGNALGEHAGLFRYTIGQRKGIGVALGEPLYVVAKDGARNALVVGTRDELMVRHVEGSGLNLVSLDPEEANSGELRVVAKTSYRQPPRAATARFSSDGITLKFDEPIVRPAPGQTLSIYDESGEAVLAGAAIA